MPDVLGWIKLGLIAAALAALVAGATWYHHKVFSDGEAAQELIDNKIIAGMKEDKARADAVAASMLEEANAKVNAKAKQLDTTLAANNMKTHQELTDANNKNAALTADLLDHKLRLSVATTGSACNQTTNNPGAGIVAGNSGQGRTELVPETAAALVRIATDGDRAVRKFNACIDSYNEVKNMINAEVVK